MLHVWYVDIVDKKNIKLQTTDTCMDKLYVGLHEHMIVSRKVQR